MLQRLSIPLLTIANLLIPIAILIFATGFFPYKPFIAGRASYGDGKDGKNNNKYGMAPFDKVVFMVVDALRRLEFFQAIAMLLLRLSAILSIPTTQASHLLKGQHVHLSRSSQADSGIAVLSDQAQPCRSRPMPHPPQ